MVKTKRYSKTSVPRYAGKVYEVLKARLGEEYAKQAAAEVQSRWEDGFIPYHSLYVILRTFLEKRHPEIPVGMYGLYRSFLYYAWKEINTGTPYTAVLDRFEHKLGLSRTVMMDILNEFGLVKTVTTRNTQPNANVAAAG